MSDKLVVIRAGLIRSQLMVTQDLRLKYKIIKYKFFFYTNALHCFYFLQFEIVQTRNRRPNLTAMLQNSNQNSHLSWDRVIRL